MTPFDVAAMLLVVAAISGYLNHRLLRLPATSGTLLVALVGAAAVIGADALLPSLTLEQHVTVFLDNIDFNETLMRGMLGFLLFAGALTVDVRRLVAYRWTILLLATVGVLVSTAVVGGLLWSVLHLAGADTTLLHTLIFGAIVSPTDPIAVLALLKQVGAPADLETQIAGESLFNDGVGVVVFFALLSVAGMDNAAPEAAVPVLSAATLYFVREVAGGAVLGGAFGYVVYRALRRVEDPPLELLLTVALVMATYALSFPLHVSGPIAIVVAGLLIGGLGRERAMSATSRREIDAFWAMIDELLNSVLFLLIGLQVFGISVGPYARIAAPLAVPIALVARVLAVALPVAMLRDPSRPRGFVPILVWSGLRGGLSVAMVLSLPPFPARGLFIACTYAVVIFSVLVQGLTMRPLLARYGFGRR